MKTLEHSHKALMPVFVLLLAGVIAAMFMLRGCSTSSPSSDKAVKSGGDTLDIAIDYGPMSMYAKGDSLFGFNYEVICSLQRRGLPVKLHPFTSLDSVLTLLDEGIYDVIATDAPVTLDYESLYTFSEPLYLDRQVLVEHIASDSDSMKPIASQLDLAGKNVWVVAGSPTEGRLHNLMDEIGDTIYIRSDNQYSSELLYMLTSIGEIKLCVINERVAEAMSRQGGGARVASGISFTQFQAWLMSKEKESAAHRIDSAIVAFKATAEFDDICRRYGVRQVTKK